MPPPGVLLPRKLLGAGGSLGSGSSGGGGLTSRVSDLERQQERAEVVTPSMLGHSHQGNLMQRFRGGQAEPED